MSPQTGEETIFELALDGAIPARGETAQLVAIARALSAMPDPEIDGHFAAKLAGRISDQSPTARPVAHLRVVPEASTPSEGKAEVIRMPRHRGGVRVRRGVAIALVAAVLGAVPFAAAVGASPRSPFYGLKRAIERIELSVFGTPLEDGFTYMKLADRRIAEARALGSSGDVGLLVERLLGEASADMRHAQSLVLKNTSERAVLERLAGLARTTEQVLQASAATMPEKVALERAIDSSRSIQQAVARALGSSSTRSPSESSGVYPSAVSRSVRTTIADDSSSAPVSSKADAKSGSAPPGASGTGDPLSPADGCEAPGSANGLGDVLAAAKLLLCR